jgi:hypothetical protein
MAARSNTNRKRIIRSAIASVSLLSLLPLVGVMLQAQTQYTTDAGSIAAAPAAALMTTDVATGAASTTTATGATQSASTTKATSPVSYTRTKAS